MNTDLGKRAVFGALTVALAHTIQEDLSPYQSLANHSKKASAVGALVHQGSHSINCIPEAR